MKNSIDYILAKFFNMIYFVLNKLGVFYIFAPLFTKINELLHLKNSNRIKKIIEKKRKNEIKAPNVINALPNSGGLVFESEFIKYKTSSGKVEGSKPSKIEGYEGVALDDALSYKLEWRHLSFYPITEAIDKISKTYLHKNNYSLLELGCGAGSIFEFLKYNNCSEYIGIDANTIALENSPYMKDSSKNFKALNLQQEINLNHIFDIVISFEVLEHLKKDSIPSIAKTIANHMNGNSIFLGTACLREMEVHLTVESEEWWLESFKKERLIPHPESKKITDQLIKNHPYNWNIGSSVIFALRKE